MRDRVEKVGTPRIGLAERAMRRFKRRKVEMKMTLDDEVIGWLNLMVRVPEAMPLRVLLGPAGERFTHYKAPDEAAARQMIALRSKWLEAKLLKVKDHNERGQPVYDIGPDPIDTSLKQTFIDRIRELQKHYKDLGMTAPFLRPYMKLQAILDGKALDIDALEDPSEDDAAPDQKGEGE